MFQSIARPPFAARRWPFDPRASRAKQRGWSGDSAHRSSPSRARRRTSAGQTWFGAPDPERGTRSDSNLAFQSRHAVRHHRLALLPGLELDLDGALEVERGLGTVSRRAPAPPRRRSAPSTMTNSACFGSVRIRGGANSTPCAWSSDQMVVEWYLPTAFLRALNRTPRAMRAVASGAHVEGHLARTVRRSLAQYDSRACPARAALAFLPRRAERRRTTAPGVRREVGPSAVAARVDIRSARHAMTRGGFARLVARETPGARGWRCVEFRLARARTTSESPRLITRTPRGARRSASMSLATISALPRAETRGCPGATRARASQTHRARSPARVRRPNVVTRRLFRRFQSFPARARWPARGRTACATSAADMHETPLRLLGTRTVTLPGDDTVLLRSSTAFPRRQNLEPRLRRAPSRGSPRPERYSAIRSRRPPGRRGETRGVLPIVSAASEHPARRPEDFSVVA